MVHDSLRIAAADSGVSRFDRRVAVNCDDTHQQHALVRRRGVWIPKISTEQFGATLGRWFGASDDELAWAFPSIELYANPTLGFL